MAPGQADSSVSLPWPDSRSRLAALMPLRLVLALLAAALLVPASPAVAKRKLCLAVSADSKSYPVRVLKGDVSCMTARSTLKRYIIKFTAPKGWTCFRGHGQDIWAVTCIKGSEAHPSVLIRAYNPA
jgi:hypothetical protein